MLGFPRWKITAVLFVCAIFLLLASPNFLSSEKRAGMPGWYPTRTVNLGLDLHGGSHLLLRVDLDTYLQGHIADILDEVRMAFERREVRYTGLEIHEGKIAFSLAEGQDISVSEVLRRIDPGLAMQQEGNSYLVSFSEAGLRRAQHEAVKRSMEIIDRRAEETGTRESIVQQQGNDHILLQVSGLTNSQTLKKLLEKMAEVSFHLVDASATQSGIEHGQVAPDSIVMPSVELDDRGQAIKYAIKRRALLNGNMLMDVAPTRDQMGRPAMTFRFNPLGTKRFGEMTTEHVGQSFAIVVDGEILTVPRIDKPVTDGNVVVTGQFTPAEIGQLAILLRSGSLPAPLHIVEEREVGPGLGADVIAAGKKASLFATALIFGFMFLSYGLFGLFSTIVLLINIAIILTVLSLLQTTLTLPGLFGIFLALVMAVDGNVLIFERIREEIARGKSAYAAVDNGFKIAFRTILNSSITVLIAALILFYFGTSSIKGFAVTLTIGILSSMFSAIVLTRLMAAMWMRCFQPKTIPI